MKTLLFIFSMFAAHSLHASQGAILVIRPEGTAFGAASRGLYEALYRDFAIQELIIGERTSQETVTGRIEASKPVIAVLMDNRAIRFFTGYQEALPPEADRIPSVAIMSIQVEKAVSRIRNSACITYEVPVITSITNLRQVISEPIKKVGIIHRGITSEFIRNNIEFAEKEGVHLLSCEVTGSRDTYEKQLNSCLDKLFRQEMADALWVPNDNLLLTPELMKNVWVRMGKKYRKPVIVGVESLVHPKLDFGTFAVLPDNFILGGQAADLIFEAQDSGWRFPANKFEPPVAVNKILNIEQARKYFTVNENSLRNTVDKVSK